MFKLKMIGSIVIGIITLLASPKLAYAHERWFVESGTHSGERLGLDVTSVFLLFGAVFLGAMAYTNERSGWTRGIRIPFQSTHRLLPRGMEWRVVASLSGIMLIINSIMGVFLASEFILPQQAPFILGQIGQMVIGLLLVSQMYFAVGGALVLLVAVPIAAIYLPANLLIDYVVEFAALAAALILVGLTSCPDRLFRKWIKTTPERLEHLALPIIRIGTGLTLVILALHNKLLNPDIALTFLDKYAFNFMPYIGLPWFTNLHFVFAAGVAEVTLGLILMLGLATRFVAAVILGFFITTLIMLGPMELVGHLPLLGIMFLLIYLGSGRYSLAAFRGVRSPGRKEAGVESIQ